MKNPILLFIVWLVLFFSEIAFSWNFLGMPLKPHLSYFLLGYIFFTAPPLSSLFFGSLAFVISASFASSQILAFLPFSILYGLIFSLRGKTALLDPLFSKTSMVFLILLVNFNLVGFAQEDSFRLSSVFSTQGLAYFLYWIGHWAIGLFLFWGLEQREKLLQRFPLANRTSKRRAKASLSGWAPLKF